ncbi:hypothetical protein CAPTEDRAFT_229373 [Capitella teleta]|uniref:procollagen-proline 4-dioxygenase n=1 Tax=Capitella teleta TaxID=283909 RepID=R7V085_CAPTE|nr:hypothetical protein CAPTEDRAFT_229373 [Capitella teleta]|eukprot:ELU09607.1 hypothetical protein CAPTEDRAFT_229373 [Capitella teleta]
MDSCKLTFAIGLLLSLLCRPGTPEMFSSTRQLIKLLAAESRILTAAEDFITQEKERLQSLKDQLKLIRKRYNEGLVPRSPDYQETRGYIVPLPEPPEVEAERVDYVGHPVNAYNLIKTWHSVSYQIVEQSRLNQRGSLAQYDQVNECPIPLLSPTDFHDTMASLSTSMPTQTDISGSIDAIVRLQETYELPTNSTADGVVMGTHASGVLSSRDCYVIARKAEEIRQSGFAIQWYEKALENSYDEWWVKDAFYRLGTLLKGLASYERGLGYLRIAQEMDPENRTVVDMVASAENTVDRNENFTASTYRKPPHEYRRYHVGWLSDYMKLCRGEHFDRDPEVVKALYCTYRYGILPYLRYNEEIFNFNPRIALIYNVIKNRDINMLKDKATAGLSSSRVGDPAKSKLSNERISKTSWLWDTEDERIFKLSKQVADITGLSTQYSTLHSHAEPFQLVNYGIGGQYQPHFDYYENDMLRNVPAFIQDTGDRVATFMFYLSSVKAGGATVFPKLHVRIPAVKGAAAFWFNIRRSGDREPLTQHAGCPVLLGEKWVANKWIRELGQEYNRPCGLTPEATDFDY